jgi:hypothetical protein
MPGNFAVGFSLQAWRRAVQDSGLSPLTKLVCLNLSLYMTEVLEGCRPGLREQMRHTGLTKLALLSHLDDACECGYVLRHIEMALTTYCPTLPGSIAVFGAIIAGTPPSPSSQRRADPTVSIRHSPQ